MRTLKGLAALLTVLCATSASALQYTVLDLPTIYSARDLSDGFILGITCDGPSKPRPTVWDVAGISEIRRWSETDVIPSITAINNHGSAILYDLHNSFVWTASGSTQLSIPGADWTAAMGINDHDQIVGSSVSSADAPPTGWVLDGGTLSFLPSLPGGVGCRALDINNAGRIVGNAAGHDQATKPVMWEDGNIRTLPMFEEWDAASAIKVNDNGWATGLFLSPGQPVRAALWNESGAHDLGVLPGCTMSSALGINNLNQVIGNSGGPTSESMFIWTQETGMLDLKSLIPADSGWSLTSVHAINNRGQILAFGQRGSTYSTLLLNPVPEPSSLLALGSGLLALGGLIRRRR